MVGDASVTRGAAFQNEPGGPAAGAPATYILGQSGWLSPRPSWSPLPPRSGVGETSTDSALSAVSPSPFPHAGRRSRRGGAAPCAPARRRLQVAGRGPAKSRGSRRQRFSAAGAMLASSRRPRVGPARPHGVGGAIAARPKGAADIPPAGPQHALDSPARGPPQAGI